LEDRHQLGAVDDVSAVMAAHSLYRFFHAGDDEALALQGVSLTLEPGEVVAVSGPSGSGKSTLLSCLAGLDEPDGGTVEVSGERISRRSEGERAALRSRHIGVLYQQANLIGQLSVRDNVSLVQRLADSPTGDDWREQVLESCGIAHRAGARPSQLSGGELARAGLAVALAAAPAVVLADEPTGELDEDSAERVVGLLRRQAERGGAVLIVTHSSDVVGRCDREIRLRDGRVVAG
jgi:putative ABC transport system ATP-binding protein